MYIATLRKQIENALTEEHVVDFETLFDDLNKIHPLKRQTLNQRFKRAMDAGKALSINTHRVIDRATAERWKEKHVRRSLS